MGSLSYPCTRAFHGYCYSKNCICDCHHRDPFAMLVEENAELRRRITGVLATFGLEVKSDEWVASLIDELIDQVKL